MHASMHDVTVYEAERLETLIAVQRAQRGRAELQKKQKHEKEASEEESKNKKAFERILAVGAERERKKKRSKKSARPHGISLKKRTIKHKCRPVENKHKDAGRLEMMKPRYLSS